MGWQDGHDEVGLKTSNDDAHIDEVILRSAITCEKILSKLFLDNKHFRSYKKSNTYHSGFADLISTKINFR